MFDNREKEWTVSDDRDYTCPHCDEGLWFEEDIEEDVMLDIGTVIVDWQAHCPKCGRQYKLREVFKHSYTKIFEND